MNRRLLGAVAAVVALVLGAGALFLLLPERDQGPAGAPAPTSSAPSAPTSTTTAPRVLVDGPVGVPTRIEIAELGVDAPVMAVGTTPENAQEVPSSLDATGWWRDGAEPGAPGNAVIVGHTASVDDAVFDPLVDAEVGDEVFVTGSAGTVAFTVARTETVPVADFGDVAADVYRSEGDSGLVLMTCGDWNGTAFESTVIVHAVPAGAAGA